MNMLEHRFFAGAGIINASLLHHGHEHGVTVRIHNVIVIAGSHILSASRTLQDVSGETEDAIDQRQMAQRLREITGKVTTGYVVLLREETEIVGERQHALEQGPGFVMAALHASAVNKPKAAGEKCAFRRRRLRSMTPH